MNDRENRNQRRQQRRNTGAGSRQQEQATAGGTMRDEDGEDFGQMEQQGGTYRPAGDRGLDFEADRSGDFDIEDDQPSQQAGTARQQEGFGRGRQQEQSEPDRRRQAEQQGGMGRQPGERDWDEEDR